VTALNTGNRYHRATVALWARSHADLLRRARCAPLAEAAIHAVLARLRCCTEPAALFASYEADTGADLALIASLVLGDAAAELLWRVRDAAYYLRWRELTEDQDGGA
jgi:hypothetical protein